MFAITSEGRALRLQGLDIDEVSGRSRGAEAAKKFGANRGEQILTVVAPSSESLVLVTQSGLAKRLAPDVVADLRHGRPVFGLKGNDKVAVGVHRARRRRDRARHADAQVLRTAVDGISVQGATAAGVTGMNVKGGVGRRRRHRCSATPSSRPPPTSAPRRPRPSTSIPAYGRGSAGVRLTKLGDASRIVAVYVGALDGMQAVMTADGSATQADPNPVAFPLRPTKRDLVSTHADHGRRVLAIGTARW